MGEESRHRRSRASMARPHWVNVPGLTKASPRQVLLLATRAAFDLAILLPQPSAAFLTTKPLERLNWPLFLNSFVLLRVSLSLKQLHITFTIGPTSVPASAALLCSLEVSTISALAAPTLCCWGHPPCPGIPQLGRAFFPHHLSSQWTRTFFADSQDSQQAPFRVHPVASYAG